LPVTTGIRFFALLFPFHLFPTSRQATRVTQYILSRFGEQAAASGSIAALSINQPKISALKHYKLEGFSVERLMTFLTTLGSDIEIRVHLPKRSSLPGRILVNAA
jgi:predicted XRE-type DNA-binding protein